MIFHGFELIGNHGPLSWIKSECQSFTCMAIFQGFQRVFIMSFWFSKTIISCTWLLFCKIQELKLYSINGDGVRVSRVKVFSMVLMELCLFFFQGFPRIPWFSE